MSSEVIIGAAIGLLLTIILATMMYHDWRSGRARWGKGDDDE